TVYFVTTALFNTMVELQIDSFKHVRQVLTGGEIHSMERMRKALATMGPGRINHVYGPTETTVFATGYLIETIDKESNVIPIGGPIANTQIYILDTALKPVPIGVPGIIYIGGDGTASGYLNNPEQTAEKFITNPYAHQHPQKDGPHLQHAPILYNSGDLGRWRPGGEIEFIGRKDQQVKIRGYRIEMGEIENRLLTHPAIKEAVLMARQGQDGDKQLCAYYEATQTLDIEELNQYLTQTLPQYMIPAFFVKLDRIPLTVNGKVDKKALTSHEIEKLEGQNKYTPPRDALEKKLVGIWAGILNLDEELIGVESNFFHQGGHSLKAAILVAKIHKELDVSVPLAKIFETPTIAGIAAYIRQAARDKYIAIPPVEEKEYYPLSPAQKRLYILQNMEPGNKGYNMSVLFRTEGKLHKQRLEKTFKQLIISHESLRTTFHMIGVTPVQKIQPEVEFAVQYYEGEEERTVETEFFRAFDLEKAPLIRVAVFGNEENNRQLAVDMHHIISDGTSMGVIIREFMVLYNGEELQTPGVRYRDYEAWRNRRTENRKRQETYWMDTYSDDIPVLELPTDYAALAQLDIAGTHTPFEIGPETVEALNKLAAAHSATLYMVLLTAYYIMLAKLSGAEDIVVGTPEAGRGHEDLNRVVGMFVNTLALRNYPGAKKTFTQFLEEVKTRTLQAFENRDYPFEDLVDNLAPERTTGKNPLFDVMFTLQNV
ncbi:MAG: AMP-binding protein, partial [bacterium]|nr:AMP-binding protein [bacterium]